MSWTITPAYKGAAVSDPDAQTYLRAVETADGQPLEPAVARAVNEFVLGCKADGIWGAIKASCILAGARTLSGALVPLIGTAPTNPSNVFVQADYNRKTGLAGNGTTKFLNSNRASNADPQNNRHGAVWRTEAGSGNRSCFGAGVTTPDVSVFAHYGDTSNEYFACNGAGNDNSTYFSAASSNRLGLLGTSRSSSGSFSTLAGSTSGTTSNTSTTPLTTNVLIFARGTPASPNTLANSRLAFYSLGESLDLAKLSNRLSVLISAFSAAIA